MALGIFCHLRHQNGLILDSTPLDESSFGIGVLFHIHCPREAINSEDVGHRPAPQSWALLCMRVCLPGRRPISVFGPCFLLLSDFFPILAVRPNSIFLRFFPISGFRPEIGLVPSTQTRNPMLLLGFLFFLAPRSSPSVIPSSLRRLAGVQHQLLNPDTG